MTVYVNLMVENVIQNTNGIMTNANKSEKKQQIKHGICNEDYTWNPTTCTWECGKDCQLG